MKLSSTANPLVTIVAVPRERFSYTRKSLGRRGEKDDQFLSRYLARKTKVATLSKNRRFSNKAEIEYIKAGFLTSINHLVISDLYIDNKTINSPKVHALIPKNTMGETNINCFI